MAAVRSRHTKPEMRVRRAVHAMGYRYSLHKKDLPGSPDLVFTSRKKILFVHGCFWHVHECRAGRNAPASNLEYWRKKRRRNVARDRRDVQRLIERGWQVLVVWECETKDRKALAQRLGKFLKAAQSRRRVSGRGSMPSSLATSDIW